MPTVFITNMFGSSSGGLTTVGVTIKNRAGTVLAARTTQGVVDLGGGVYGCEVDLSWSDVQTPGRVLVVLWDNGANPPRFASNLIDFSGQAESQIGAVLAEVQGLKEKNIRKIADDPRAPTQIEVAVKREGAPDWSPSNLHDIYDVRIRRDSAGKVIQYGG